ncbi:hypothetical protein RchiOBHm_Chr4g0392561 [Rosa chinensis]|uniref:Uncharacterized protein n=1 Tax=Rosa chinensis TaxID=74649 RepID=A0A2P6QQR6_ROSCH|nr:hypothetical protein RchiOBHm_Chr4g0392561 [Rosa chinensis]
MLPMSKAKGSSSSGASELAGGFKYHRYPKFLYDNKGTRMKMFSWYSIFLVLNSYLIPSQWLLILCPYKHPPPIQCR